MERLRGTKEVLRVTGAAALEGAAIGSLMLGPLPGFFAGGIVGGVTALALEGIGRGVKVDIKGPIEVKTTVTDEGTVVYRKQMEADLPKQRVPWIQVPDYFLQLLADLSPKFKTKLDFTNVIKPDSPNTSTWTIESPSPSQGVT